MTYNKDGSERKKPVRLNYKEFGQLEEWIKKNLTRIKKRRMTRAGIAEVAGRELGVLYSKANIVNVCKHGNIKLPHGYTHTGGRIPPFTVLSARVSVLEEDMDLLKKLMINASEGASEIT